MKRFLLRVWRILPAFLQELASMIILPHFEVAAGAIVLNERGQILLCEHTYRRRHPWGLPGGGVKVGEDPAEAVRRELREETGFSAQDTRLLLVENPKELHTVLIVYLCSGVSGEFVANEEVCALRYFDTEALPDLFTGQRTVIQKALAVLCTQEISG